MDHIQKNYFILKSIPIEPEAWNEKHFPMNENIFVNSKKLAISI